VIRFRDLGLAGKAVAALVAAVLIALAVMAVSRWWDDLWDWLPWSTEQRLERAETRAETAQADAAARRTEVAWLEKQQADVAEATRVLIETRTVTERAVTRAEEAPDASVEIDPDRADRLRDADRRLCGLAPVDCGTGPAPDRPAGPGDPAVSPAGPAGRSGDLDRP
jgi:hypothetical protein